MKTFLLLLAFLITSQIHGQTQVEFIVEGLPEGVGSTIGIRGDQEPLSWFYSMPMTKVDNGYMVQVTFAEEVKAVEFKFVHYSNEEIDLVWEGTENRILMLKTGSEIKSVNQWDVDPIIDPTTIPILTSEELLADYHLIEKMVLEVHPGTYRYNDKEAIQRGLQELKTAFSSPQSRAEAYLAISKLLAQIKCDHTHASFYNQNNTIKSVIHRQKDKLPFTFRWIDGNMVVVYDGSEERRIRTGSIISTINGVPVTDIKKAMLPYISADGNNYNSRLAKMEIKSYDFRYDAFDVFFPLLYPMEKPTFEIDFRAPGAGYFDHVTIAATTRQERNRLIRERYEDFPATRDDLISFSILDNNIGLLKIGSFGNFGWKKLDLDYQKFLANTFKEIKEKKVEHLIVDLRENTGGADEMKHQLFSYFPMESIKPKKVESRSRYKVFPEELKTYAKSWGGPKPWYYKLKPDKVDKENGYYIFEESIANGMANPRNPDYFTGKLYFLTSPSNVSLAFYLAEDVKSNQIGTIVGRETGGNLRGINGGQILFLRLPHSEIEIDFPVVGVFATDDQPDQGVRPDLLVVTKNQNIVNWWDPELQAVKELILSQ